MSSKLFKYEDMTGGQYAHDAELLAAFLDGHVEGERYAYNMLVRFVHPWVAAWRALMRPMRYGRQR